MRLIPFFLIVFAAVCVSSARAPQSVTIISSGEMHAQLDSCGCPTNPVGGLTRIATVAKTLRRNASTLLLDAGGFAAGGIYDINTEGRIDDSIRTMAMVDGMGRTGYDAVAIGDEELGFGMRRMAWIADDARLPIVCANAFYVNGHYVTQPYRFVKKDGITFGITALTTADKMFDTDTSVRIENPDSALRRIWPKLIRKSDVIVVLSHLGEEETAALRLRFPEARIWVNGHRKTDPSPALIDPLLQTASMQFGFQGKQLSTLRLQKTGRQYQLSAPAWISINDTIEPDPDISLLSGRYASYRKGFSGTFDLYMMSQCPYGIPALGELVQLAQRAGNISLKIWFVGDVIRDSLGRDSLRSLHGPEEILDEKRWLAVEALYPDLRIDFFALRTLYGLPTAAAMNELNLDTALIASWVDRQGFAALAAHYRRSNRLDINASPTLYVNNAPWEKDIAFTRFAKGFCAQGKAPQVLCDSLPQCIDNEECTKSGYIGLCGDDGVCTFLRDPDYTFRVIIPDSSLVHTELPAIETTRRLFPAARIVVMRRSDPLADSLLRQYAVQTLPFYQIGADIRLTHNYAQVEKGLVPLDSMWMTFAPGIMKPAYFFRREAQNDRVEIFADPMSRAWHEALQTTAPYDSALSRIRFWPLFALSGDSASDSLAIARVERARLWLTCAIYYPSIYRSFLDSVATDPSPGRLSAFLTARGIEPDAFTAGLARVEEYAAGLQSLERSFDRRDPVLLLYGNRELISIESRARLSALLDQQKRK